MSLDQALLESVNQSQIPMLRFYQWTEPTLSLGYFQKLADRNQHVASSDANCVRRSTGGGSILHHHELTYSIAIPVTSSHSGARLDLYQGMHAIISDALSDWSIKAVPHRDINHRTIDCRPTPLTTPPAATTLAKTNGVTSDQPPPGPQSSTTAGGISDEALLCFQRRTDEDLIVSGYKILGSAQRRAKNAVLQHGSLLLQASPFAPELPGVLNLGSRPLCEKELAQAISTSFSQRWQIDFQASKVSVDETTRAREIAATRFNSTSWLKRR
ncbi:lipoate--protein ligase family protein [Planctomycetes bacterium K23_9]|uniref:Octanoyltransferase LipM n=1 Tax=Stieleria marina TaxID=1930275 RepID=A0A517NN52_9BACT|nr:Octanoyltransferase LipM [Planctomycetes bacterium K23_9]